MNDKNPSFRIFPPLLLAIALALGIVYVDSFQGYNIDVHKALNVVHTSWLMESGTLDSPTIQSPQWPTDLATSEYFLTPDFPDHGQALIQYNRQQNHRCKIIPPNSHQYAPATRMRQSFGTVYFSSANT